MGLESLYKALSNVITRNARLNQCCAPVFINTMHGKLFFARSIPILIIIMTFPFGGLDENDTFHLGTFDAVRGNFAAPSGRRSPFYLLGPLSLSLSAYVFWHIYPASSFADSGQ